MSADTTYIVNTNHIIHEGESYNIHFRVVDPETAAAVTVNSAKVYVYNDGATTFINGRDGTSSTGLTVTDTNLVTYTMSPADNAIVNTTTAATNGFEKHHVLIEVTYSTTQKYYREYIINVNYNAAVSPV